MAKIIRICNQVLVCNQDNFGHDTLKMEQDLPHFYADNFSRDLRILDEMYIGRGIAWECPQYWSSPLGPATNPGCPLEL